MNPTTFLVLSLVFMAPLSVFASSVDERIESAATNSYVYKNYLQDDAIKTSSKDGVVTLTGTVVDDNHKILAEDTVAQLPGVVRVDNKLEVRPPAEDMPEHSDGWLGVKVKAALLFHRHVSALNTHVDVKDGIVTLRGEAANSAQRELTTLYAKDIKGVKDVINEMTVVENKEPEQERSDERLSDKIDDASITAQVKMALLAHHSTSAIRTKVQTTDGMVTLTGTAKSQEEKELAAKVASDIKGVQSVDNKMVVEP
jgi:hyperosmotically inducible periplasmic protein